MSWGLVFLCEKMQNVRRVHRETKEATVESKRKTHFFLENFSRLYHVAHLIIKAPYNYLANIASGIGFHF